MNPFFKYSNKYFYLHTAGFGEKTSGKKVIIRANSAEKSDWISAKNLFNGLEFELLYSKILNKDYDNEDLIEM